MAKEKLEPINGLDKLVKWIETRGLRRAAVTNAPRPNADMMVSVLGLSDFFEFVIVGDECERAKPFPDPYLKALEQLKLSKDHTFICEVCPLAQLAFKTLLGEFSNKSHSACFPRILFQE